MSMRTLVRKQAHEKAEMLGIKRVNKQQYYQGRRTGSMFSVNWKKLAATRLPKPRKNATEDKNG